MNPFEGREVRNTAVLCRLDLNVPLDAGAVADDTRLEAVLPTVRSLADRGARIVLCSHLGRPKGHVVEELRLKPVSERLSHLLGFPVQQIPTTIGDHATAAVKELEPGHALLLENLRFHAGETGHEPAFADQLAVLGDSFVLDAFGVCHRNHASVVGLAKRLPTTVGPLIRAELAAFARVLQSPERPFVAVLGGAKVADKIPVIENLLGQVDAVLVGGAMANTFMAALGQDMGASLVDHDLVDTAARLIEQARSAGVPFHLPLDLVVTDDINDPGPSSVVADVRPGAMAVDIGPATCGAFAEVIAGARTIVWNGPMGVFEKPPWDEGTRSVAQSICESDAYSVIGGGDSAAAVRRAGLASQVGHLSTGGGASLQLLQGTPLPGLQAAGIAVSSVP